MPSGDTLKADAIIGGGVLALMLALAACGCGSDRSVARIVNDLDRSVRLRLCSSNDCLGFYPPDGTLPPGEDWQVNVSSVGVPNVYLVETPDESGRYGCLPLVAPDWRPEVTVYVSENVPCRESLDENAFWPSRWEDVGS